MLRDFTPRVYQEEACLFALKNKRCNLWLSMGLGKSAACLMLLEALDLSGMFTSPTLVLGPLRVARDTWPGETQKWSNFNHMEVVPVIGTLEQRKAALRKPGKIFSCNYEQLVWLVDYLGSSWPFKNVIADEATRLKGFRMNQGGQRAAALAEIAHQYVDRWINLTGTPAPNGYQDLWGQQWFVDRGARLGLTHTAFSRRWFQRSWSGHGMDILPHAMDEINAKLADCTLTIDPKDHFDLADPIVHEVIVKLPLKARDVYKRLEKELFAKLESGTYVEVLNAASLSNKCLQLGNGAVYTEHPKWEAVHDAKIEALESIVGESGGSQMIVAYEFRSDLERILGTFKDAVDISTQAGMRKFKSGEAQMGVAHPASMGHGIDGLQENSNILVKFGHSWNLELSAQMLERIGPVRQKQSGFDRPVYVYNIIAEDTLDAVVIARQHTKRSVQDSLLLAMKERR